MSRSSGPAQPTVSEPQSYILDVPEAELDDLRARLRATRWPEPETVDDWSQGVPLGYLQALCSYWCEEYDWRRLESRLNGIGQFRVDIDGLGIHYLHVRSPHPAARPVLLTHGWPGSIVEFLKVIEPLVDPPAHGGDAADAFHVVCPSLPGYAFSDRPLARGWGTERIAAAWAALMAKLGYREYFAHGGDWGAAITMLLGTQDAGHVAGIHVTLPVIPAHEFDSLGSLTVDEKAAFADYARHQRSGTGYSKQQSTRPQTIGYGLVDSPAGQCAWIAEKFWMWSDWDDSMEEVISRDELLDNVMLYWLSATAASSARLYWESFRDIDIERVGVPAGCSIFPKEMFRPPRRLAERRFADLRYWNEPDRGGHFAALERPDTLIDELRACFRSMR